MCYGLCYCTFLILYLFASCAPDVKGTRPGDRRDHTVYGIHITLYSVQVHFILRLMFIQLFRSLQIRVYDYTRYRGTEYKRTDVQ